MIETITSPKRAMVCLVETKLQTDEEKHELEKLRKYLDSVLFKEYVYGLSNKYLQNGYSGKLSMISPVDSDNKMCRRHFNCISLVGFGDGVGENYSFIAHVNSLIAKPKSDEIQDRDDFLAQLKWTLLSLKKKAKGGNLEICLLAGDKRNNKYCSYDETVSLLSEVVKETLGIGIVVMDKEYVYGWRKDVYVENEKRRIYQVAEEKS